MEYFTEGKIQLREFSVELKQQQQQQEQQEQCKERTPEEVVNSIKITEGPVTHMSMAVQKTSRTPYSDATQVRSLYTFSIELEFIKLNPIPVLLGLRN
jgi:hypothetical protein